MNTEATKQTILSALRHAFTLAGGIAATRGWISKSDAVELGGAIVALVGVIWGPLDEFLAAREAQFDARLKLAVDAALQGALKAALVAGPAESQEPRVQSEDSKTP